MVSDQTKGRALLAALAFIILGAGLMFGWVGVGLALFFIGLAVVIGIVVTI